MDEKLKSPQQANHQVDAPMFLRDKMQAQMMEREGMMTMSPEEWEKQYKREEKWREYNQGPYFCMGDE